jgi:hypothetical protein
MLFNSKALDQNARRAARKVGLIAKKRRGRHSLDNLGEFMLIDPRSNCVVRGPRFDMTAREVITFCRGDA